MTEIHGTCEPRFETVRAALAANFEPGSTSAPPPPSSSTASWWSTCGAAPSTTPARPGGRHDHQRLVDDQDDDGAVRAATGRPRRDRPRRAGGRYWPEFAAAGKDGILVRHLLGHTAGLSGWPSPCRSRTSTTGTSATSRLAAQAPWWEPGTASGYHAITQGYLVGEVVRRVTGVSRRRRSSPRSSPGRSAPTSTSAPARSTTHRVASVIPPPPLPMAARRRPETSIAVRTLTNPPLRRRRSRWDDPWRRAEIPAANGHGNARSVARVQRCWPAAARSAACACSRRPVPHAHLRGADPRHRPRAGRRRCALGIGYGLSPELPIGPTRGPASGVDGAARSWSTTSTRA